MWGVSMNIFNMLPIPNKILCSAQKFENYWTIFFKNVQKNLRIESNSFPFVAPHHIRKCYFALDLDFVDDKDNVQQYWKLETPSADGNAVVAHH